MTDEELQRAITSYLEAFAITNPGERERLLRSSLMDDVVYSNPGVSGRGVRDLSAHVERFQKRFPGGRFRVSWLRHQHAQALFEWTQLDGAGSEIVTGHSYARFADSGLIAHLAGFWSPGAV